MVPYARLRRLFNVASYLLNAHLWIAEASHFPRLAEVWSRVCSDCLFRLSSQPFNASLQGFWNAVRPNVQGDNLLGPVTIRLQIQALFPTGG